MPNTKYSSSPSSEAFWFLSQEALENPQKAIYDFFDTYSLGSSHDRLWQMLKQTISSNAVNGWNEVQRANCIHFYELLTELLNANYVLFLKIRAVEKPSIFREAYQSYDVKRLLTNNNAYEESR